MIQNDYYSSITPEQYEKIFPAAPKAQEKAEKGSWYGRFFSSCLEQMSRSLGILSAKIEVFFQTQGKVWPTFEGAVDSLEVRSFNIACLKSGDNKQAIEAIKTQKAIHAILNKSPKKEKDQWFSTVLGNISTQLNEKEMQIKSIRPFEWM